MSLIVYVSGHGFGHAAREIEILRHLPPEIPLTIKTASPEWFWRSELKRPFEIESAAFDVGTKQKDSLDSDPQATLAAWKSVDAANQARLAAECEDLARRGARLIVTDVPSFPISVAERLGIPSICVANFTWADIYADLIPAEPGLEPVVEQLRSEYARTSLLLEAGFALPMPYFPHRVDVGRVARSGESRRSELLAHLGLPETDKKLALIYAGNWGLPLPYEKLDRFSDWMFLSLDPLPVTAPNIIVASRDWMAHPDLVASVDLVISKIGYGLVGECLNVGTPILYCPRTGFAEYLVIHSYLSERPHGIRLSLEDFLSLNWEEALAGVPPYGTLPRETAPGGPAAAAQIANLYS